MPIDLNSIEICYLCGKPYREGSYSDRFYIIVEGRFDVSKMDAMG